MCMSVDLETEVENLLGLVMNMKVPMKFARIRTK